MTRLNTDKLYIISCIKTKQSVDLSETDELMKILPLQRCKENDSLTKPNKCVIITIVATWLWVWIKTRPFGWQLFWHLINYQKNQWENEPLIHTPHHALLINHKFLCVHAQWRACSHTCVCVVNFRNFCLTRHSYTRLHECAVCISCYMPIVDRHHNQRVYRWTTYSISPRLATPRWDFFTTQMFHLNIAAWAISCDFI